MSYIDANLVKELHRQRLLEAGVIQEYRPVPLAIRFRLPRLNLGSVQPRLPLVRRFARQSS